MTGETIKGLRKYGPSKQHQPAPLVEMGLFMDADGIPLSMCIASGSDNEQTTAVPLEKQLIKMFQGKKFIYCADAGPGSLNIRNFNSMGVRAFIVTQSIKKMSGPLQKAVFNDCDYRLLSSDQKVSVENLKTFDKNNPSNKKLYTDKAYKTIGADKALDLGFYEEKVLANGRKRKVKSKAVVKQKVIITFSIKMMEYQRFIRNRQVERARNRYTALLIYRLLEKKLDHQGTHFTVENIVETLRNMEVANIEDMCYMSTYTCSQVCTALNAAFSLGLDRKYYQPKELNKRLKKISK